MTPWIIVPTKVLPVARVAIHANDVNQPREGVLARAEELWLRYGRKARSKGTIPAM